MKRIKNKSRSLFPYFKIAVFSFLLLCIVSVLLIGNLFFRKGDGYEIDIPSFIGKSQDEIYDIDGVITIMDYIYSDLSEKGTVIGQSYVGKTKVSNDRVYTLNITVSLGSETVDVPSLVGMSVKDAQRILRDIGIYANIEYVFGDYEDEVVLYHIPRKNTKIKANGQVTLYIPRVMDNDSVMIPEFEGMDVLDALALAEKNNIIIGNIYHIYTEDIPDGYVIAQSIPSGSLIKAKSKIDFKVAKSINYNTKDKKESRIKLWMDRKREE